MLRWLSNQLAGRGAQRIPTGHRAEAIMRRLNPNVLHGAENGREVFVEDWFDPDGRPYRLEYQCDTGGGNCTAYVRHNPWGNNPYPSTQSHLFSNGQICLGNGTYSLEQTVLRARYFCTAYSYFREHGSFPHA